MTHAQFLVLVGILFLILAKLERLDDRSPTKGIVWLVPALSCFAFSAYYQLMGWLA